jgi:phosphatidylinositol-3,4,5-trisphosphate 3-phosphatase/dual-specificity protein phosphatase PTEN
MEEERRRKRECGCRILTNFLRRKVSLKKKRWKQDGFDLDLAFIGKQKRLIAMGYPTQGCESIYRNEMGETERFFEQAPGFAKSSVRVYNLCAEANRQYDSKYFGGQVVVYPFADHHACPLALMQPFCEDVQEWLDDDSENVAAIHCKAGKGRTGTMICAYLVHSGECKTAEAAMTKFGKQRTKNGKGVTIPSQRRYVNYYEKLRRSNFSMTAHCYSITKIVISGRGKPSTSFCVFDVGDGCTSDSFTVIFDSEEGSKSFQSDSKTTHTHKVSTHDDGHYTEFSGGGMGRMRVCGDFAVQFYQQKGGKRKKTFCYWVNTAFLGDGQAESFTQELGKAELDKANKSKKYGEDFLVATTFKRVQDSSLPHDPDNMLDRGGSAHQVSQRLYGYVGRGGGRRWSVCSRCGEECDLSVASAVSGRLEVWSEV